MHEDAGGNSVYGRLYINGGPTNGFIFGDSTSALIDGFNDIIGYGRQMLIVDFNNDGYNDILRGCGSNSTTEVYYNNGPPNYDFGDVNQQPDVSISSMGDGQAHNVEGVGAIDWNQDGWLDLVIDNDNGGNDIFENDQSGGFTYIDPGTDPGETGFPASHAGDGDYLTVADVDNDGYVDLYGRKTSVNNYWRFNEVTGQFVNQANPDIKSKENDKGGVMFCDFDNDGDLDLFWTSFGENEIWLYDGVDSVGNDIWTETNVPEGSLETQSGIDGCDCGDVDNDGDLDIVLGASSGNSYLLVNQLIENDTMTFNTTNIAVNENSEGLVLTDYDQDGDLDLYLIIDDNTNPNQLWENSTNDNNFMYINALFDNGNSTSRYAIGANIILTDCDGNASGSRQVNGGKGHGTQHQTKVHFGVDPSTTYVVSVYYVYENGRRAIVRKSFTPSDYPNRELTILDTDVNDVDGCTDIDGDGMNDLYDIDDDNDGIPDVAEICGLGATGFSCLDTILYNSSNNGIDPSGDEDGDGIPNYQDADDPSIFHLACLDANSDGYCDAINPVFDQDQDGVPNFSDLDADNDGIPDIVEIGGIDANGDGHVDQTTDDDGDGLANIYDNDDEDGPSGSTPCSPYPSCLLTSTTSKLLDTNADGTTDVDANTDNDNYADYLDLDSDNDGIPDLVEAGATDLDNDAKVSTSGNWDADGDGLTDLYDENASDGPSGIGSNGTALIETSIDANNDGILNGSEAMQGGGSNRINGDLDIYPNHLDLDSDNDGITDVVENASGKTTADESGGGDLDGIVDAYTDMVDGNGWNDNSNSTTQDSDGDGIFDYLDLDADNDGIADYLEGVCSVCPTAGVATLSDSDGDGLLDDFETMSDDNLDRTLGNNAGVSPHYDLDDDTNNIPDYLDIDTDEDGEYDWAEGFDSNGDGQAYDNILSLGTNYERDNSYPGNYTSTDTDNDGLPDWLDNQPSVAGYQLSTRPPFLDYTNPAWVDDNQNGLADIFDTEQNGTMAPTPDKDGANDDDWRDSGVLVALPVELIAFSGKVFGCEIGLNWVSELETHFAYFELEHSADGRSFNSLQKINARGGNGLTAYQYHDWKAKQNNYYRLKMVDLDGTFEYSTTINIRTECYSAIGQMEVYPNPVYTKQREINLRFHTEVDQLSFVITDLLGRPMQSLQKDVVPGWNTLKIDVTNLPTGVYYITSGNATSKRSIRFVRFQEE